MNYDSNCLTKYRVYVDILLGNNLNVNGLIQLIRPRHDISIYHSLNVISKIHMCGFEIQKNNLKRSKVNLLTLKKNRHVDLISFEQLNLQPS